MNEFKKQIDNLFVWFDTMNHFIYVNKLSELDKRYNENRDTSNYVLSMIENLRLSRAALL